MNNKFLLKFLTFSTMMAVGCVTANLSASNCNYNFTNIGNNSNNSNYGPLGYVPNNIHNSMNNNTANSMNMYNGYQYNNYGHNNYGTNNYNNNNLGGNNLHQNNIQINTQSNNNKYQPLLHETLKINGVEYSLGSVSAKGLSNVGATCFMNSTLQGFLHTKELTNYFLDNTKTDKIKKIITSNRFHYDNGSLVAKYLELVGIVWNKDRASGVKYYSPYNFMNFVQQQNPLFKKGEAGDAKDFILYFLEQMHKELKQPVPKQLGIPQSTNNQYNKQITLNNFFNEFTQETSIISDIFFGINETMNICQNCKNCYLSKGMNYPICYNYGIFNFIIFPLEEVKNFVNKYWNIQKNTVGINYCNNSVNLLQCFEFNQKTDFFTGENKNYCNICKQLTDSEYTSKIFSAPNNLILVLNRGKGNCYNIKMNFTHELDITDFVLARNSNEKIKYELYGVITHLGESGQNAHFIASCKQPNNNKWFRYNDGIVSEVKDFMNDVYNFGTPYILFYERIK